MAPITILSVAMVLIGALFLSLAFAPAGRIWQQVSGPLRRKWLIILYLMAFFLLGYIVFVSLLISDLPFPVEAVTAGVFLGGAVFVYLIVNISRRTIEQQHRAEEEVKLLNESLELRVAERTQALRLSDEFNATVMDSIADPIAVIDVATYGIIDVNQAFLAEAGLRKEQVIGKTCYEVTHNRTDPCSPPHDACPLKQTLARGDHAAEDHIHWTHTGERRFVEVLTSPVWDERGQISRVVHIQRDITERKRVEEALRRSEENYRELSIMDGLTQLYNARHFSGQLLQEIDRSVRYDEPLTLILLDLDDFKTFNDTYGHVEGDTVLARFGQVIKRCLRRTDSAYRYGGEEFTILLPRTTCEEGLAIAERIRTEFRREAFSPGPGGAVCMMASIGVAQYRHDEDVKSFIQRVDRLMYEAKTGGKDRVCFER